MFHTMMFKSAGLLKVKVKVPRTGFVPGETIPVTIELDNQSGIEIKEAEALHQFKPKIEHAFTKITLQVRLNQTQKVVGRHLSRERTKISSQKVCKAAKELSGEEKTFDMDLVIPALPPSKLMFCSFIDVEYTLEVISKHS